ncbi:MAG: hypothetical protein KDE53_31525, partial [Caldilineaceae bacterium]|nr:hypothetical protein [Caldilineaceae bacterium]
FEIIQSVPYLVSARWLFYRLLQEGFYSSKGDYKNKFCKATSAARHAFYKGWRPDTLIDETREPIERGGIYTNEARWLSAISTRLNCSLDRWFTQDYYVELWYEARAMTAQFEHYTKHITLRPLGGQPSIEYKWKAAKALENAGHTYGIPIVILYFGDLDVSGAHISSATERDVRKWCDVPFEFIPCGLTLEQVKRYHVPENLDKPGEFQWEALSDEGAREIISEGVKPYLRLDALNAVDQREQAVNTWVRHEMAGLAERWREVGA